MSKNEKIVFLALLAIVGILGVLLPRVQSVINASPSGSTFNSAKVAEIVFVPSTTTATNTSLYNSDTQTRFILDSFVACQGLTQSYTGVSALNFVAATTSTSGANVSGLNYAMNVNVSTSTSVSFVATSTEGNLTGFSRLWPAGKYLTFGINATNTATCDVGVHYIGT